MRSPFVGRFIKLRMEKNGRWWLLLKCLRKPIGFVAPSRAMELLWGLGITALRSSLILKQKKLPLPRWLGRKTKTQVGSALLLVMEFLLLAGRMVCLPPPPMAFLGKTTKPRWRGAILALWFGPVMFSLPPQKRAGRLLPLMVSLGRNMKPLHPKPSSERVVGFMAGLGLLAK